MLIVNSADEFTRCTHNTKRNKPTAGLSLHIKYVLQVCNQILTTEKYRLTYGQLSLNNKILRNP